MDGGEIRLPNDHVGDRVTRCPGRELKHAIVVSVGDINVPTGIHRDGGGAAQGIGGGDGGASPERAAAVKVASAPSEVSTLTEDPVRRGLGGAWTVELQHPIVLRVGHVQIA